MEFKRLGEHTIKCVITEEEISDMGFSVEDILGNGERTQQFMNQIFDMAEQQFQMKFDLGVKTVRADFLSDHTLALTFSEHPVGGIAEQLKDIFGGLLNSISQEGWEAIHKAAQQAEHEEEISGKGEEDEEEAEVVALFSFASIDIAAAYAKQIVGESMPPNYLYKYQGKYLLIMELTNCTEEDVLALSVVADEYASHVEVGPARRAFILEHGTRILGERAVEQLSLL